MGICWRRNRWDSDGSRCLPLSSSQFNPSVKCPIMPVTSAITRNALLGQILDDFAPRFAQEGLVRYVANNDWARQNPLLIEDLGLTPKMRRRMPDVLIHQAGINRLILIDASTSNGVMTKARRDELSQIYFGSRAGLSFVTAFTSRDEMSTSVDEIAWGTSAWIADEPAHLIHFNGDKFLGPYP